VATVALGINMQRMMAYAMMLAMVLASLTLPAPAQDTQTRAKPPPRRAPLRIDVSPSGRLYRQCSDWHVIEHRATGDTVVPRSRCWWAVR
jgi:hypothetical protein